MYMYMYIHQWPVFNLKCIEAVKNSENESIKHSPGIQVKKRANLDLSTAPTRSITLGGTFVPCRPERAAVLADHLQLVRTRSIIKGARSLCVPEQHLPLKTGFSATSSSTTRAALRWCFPSSSRLSVSPVPPRLTGCAFG